jgi:hypothetical protein
VCERLRRAASYIRENGPARHRLLEAAHAIHVLTKEEFPADFAAAFGTLLKRISSEGSIDESVEKMSAAEVEELGELIVLLHEECCPPLGRAGQRE